MTDRNAVWAAAYGAFCATRAATRAQMFIDPPEASWWERVKADAKAFADAAVADFEEPKPEPAQPPKRDESRDMWVWRDGALCAATYADLTEYRRSILGGERYAPHSQLVAAQRDSELLDAILEATGNAELVSAIATAVADRSKQ